MGTANSKLTPEQLKEYQELTFLTKQEIIKVFNRFSDLVAGENLKSEEILAKGVSFDVIMNMEEFAVNPFRDRICKVFAFHADIIRFEDFLDMMSVFSDNAPLNVKAEYAFRIYDFDEDDYLSRKDLREVVNRLCQGLNTEMSTIGDNLLNKDEMDDLLERLFAEGDLDRDGQLSYSEFEHVISKAPDFANSFRIRI